MVTYEYSVSVWPEGKIVGHLVHGTITVSAADDELAEQAVYKQILDRWGYSPEKDSVVSMSFRELEGVEQ
jgi:hypothetical protein